MNVQLNSKDPHLNRDMRQLARSLLHMLFNVSINEGLYNSDDITQGPYINYVTWVGGRRRSHPKFYLFFSSSSEAADYVWEGQGIFLMT